MKKVILGIALITGLLSCDKEESVTAENEQKLYDVSFTTNGFAQKQGDTKSTSVEKGIDYAVFNSDNIFVKGIRFEANATIKDKLLAGDYKAWMIAGTNLNGNFQGNQSQVMSDWFYYLHNINTSFYGGHVAFTVDATNEENVSVELNRFTAKLVVDITDLKDEVVKTDISINRVGCHISLNDSFSNMSRSENFSRHFAGENMFMSFIPFSSDINGSDYPDVEVSIKCWDAYQNLLAHKVIVDVKTGRNKVTTLTGTMFDGSTGDISGSGFDITINEEWGEEINQEF